METWEHWQNVGIFSLFLAYFSSQLWRSIAQKRHGELYWRSAYVVAFALGLMGFLGPVQTHHSPWHPPTLSQFLAWPAVLLGPMLAVGIYAVHGEWRSKKSWPHNSMAQGAPPAA